MRTHLLLSCAMVGLLLTLGARTTHAQNGPNPEQVAQECIEDVTSRAAVRVQRNEMLSANCVEQIEQLLENDHPVAAAQLAANCVERINHRSAHVVHRIQHRCQHCTNVLLYLGAPGLAQFVQEICMDSVANVAQSRQAAVAAIQVALSSG